MSSAEAAAGGRDPSRAIEVKKAQAAANRNRIATAITALQTSGQPVNVKSVARAAAVHPHTVRRNPDLLAEVQRLRQASWERPPTLHADPGFAAVHKALKAKLLSAQAEVSDLRQQLTQLRRDAHQALGGARPNLDDNELRELRQEIAELRVQLMNERDTSRALQEAARHHADELTASHEVARSYLRELNLAKEELLQVQRRMTAQQAKSRTASKAAAQGP